MKRTTDFYCDCDRYKWDFNDHSIKRGFCQIDTNQDVWYFGNWTNPFTLEIASYCEGDYTHQQAESEAEYIEEMLRIHRWNIENESWLGIDPGLDDRDTGSNKFTDRFKALGLGHLLHPETEPV